MSAPAGRATQAPRPVPATRVRTPPELGQSPLEAQALALRGALGTRVVGSPEAMMALQRRAGNHAVHNQLHDARSLLGEHGAPTPVREVLRRPGNRLDAAIRSEMESRFGTDFGDVRVHTGDRAAESARSMRAAAYTVGRDVVFGRDRFAPGTPEGQRLLAHELAHVVQQRRASNASATGAGAEAEASRVGAQAQHGESVAVNAAAAVGVQCAPEDEEGLANPQRKPGRDLPPDEPWLTERSKQSEESRHRDPAVSRRKRGRSKKRGPPFDDHHSLPKFLGGNRVQRYVKLTPDQHYMYHRELYGVLMDEFKRLGKLPSDAGRGSWKYSSSIFRRLSPQEQSEVLQKVVEHADAFDNRTDKAGQKYSARYGGKRTLGSQIRIEITRAQATRGQAVPKRGRRGGSGGGTSGQQGGPGKAPPARPTPAATQSPPAAGPSAKPATSGGPKPTTPPTATPAPPTPSSSTTATKPPTTTSAPPSTTPSATPSATPSSPTSTPGGAPGATAPAPKAGAPGTTATAKRAGDLARELARTHLELDNMARTTRLANWGLSAWSALGAFETAARSIKLATSTFAHGSPWHTAIEEARSVAARAREIDESYTSLNIIKGHMPSAGDPEWDSWYDLKQIQLEYYLLEFKLHEVLQTVKEALASVRAQKGELSDQMDELTRGMIFTFETSVHGEAVLFADAAGKMNRALDEAAVSYLGAQRAIEHQQRTAGAAMQGLEMRLRELGSEGQFSDIPTAELKRTPLGEFTMRSSADERAWRRIMR